MNVTVTARELLDRLVWTEACEMLGLNEWAVNEGRMSADDTVALTVEQADKLGLLRTRPVTNSAPVIVRATQTSFGCPAAWDAWGEDGSQYYLGYRHSFGRAERVRQGAHDWLSEHVAVAEFETDEDDGGVISLEEFCERADLPLMLS